MKVTYSWLREYVPLACPAELAKQLTLAGLEVESVTPVAPPFSGVVVGEVLESGRHPDAEKLSLCQVTTDGVESPADRLRREECARGLESRGGDDRGTSAE